MGSGINQTLTFDALPQERVVFSASVRDALGREIEACGAKQVFLATSKTLRRQTGAISLLASSLGTKCAAIFDGIEEHSKLESVWQAILAARKCNADILVGIGGGTIIDGLKIVQLALNLQCQTMQDLLSVARDNPRTPHAIRQIAIPTTLSGAETSAAGGGTDTNRGTKLAFANQQLVPRSIIYDPAIGALTPEWLWLSSAIRGVDHCCEGILAKNASPLFDGNFTQALHMFAKSLLRTKSVPGDPFARSESQIASYLACSASQRTGSGASHGIGYILGGRYGVHHGYASCIILPHVLRWNEPATKDRQSLISTAMGRPGLRASDAVAELVRELELPHRLRDVGIKESALKEISAEAAKHPVVRSNPRPIMSPDDVLHILQAAW